MDIHDPPPPLRHRRAIKGAIAALALVAVAVLAITLASRVERLSPTEMALGREIQPGMTVSEVTAVLRRVGVAFTVETTARGTIVVKYGREATRDGMTSSVSEQQLIFDSSGRLRDRVTASQFSMP
jgi:hypothetical protein